MKARIIANPIAARGRLREWWPQIEAVLQAENFAFETVFTASRGHGTELARRAMQQGCRMVVAAGGDGTIHEVVNGLISEASDKPDITLGIIPCGTGNDFARTLGLPNNRVEAARHLARQNGSRLVDVGEVTFYAGGKKTRRYFINVAGMGFAAEVVERAERRGKGGHWPYLSALLTTLVRYRNKPVTFRIDGREGQAILNSMVIGNGQFFGGGMHVAPQAKVDDGWLEVMMVGDLSAPAFLWHTPKLYRGTHLRLPQVTALRGRVISVASPQRLGLQTDGEWLGEAPATFRLLPARLRIRG